MKHSLALALGLSLAPLVAAQPAARAPLVTTLGLEPTVRGGHSLRRGDSGAAVRELQTLLVRHGHPVGVDGDFGPETEAAVRALQRQRGLDPDGVVGPITLGQLLVASSAAAGSAPGNHVVGVLGGQGSSRPPAASTSPAEAYAASLPWAREARAAGRRRLIVVFEGLWAWSGAYSERVYAYQDALRAGRSAAPPPVSGLSFVTKQLIVPNLSATLATSDLLLLPETSENGDTSVGEQACRAWHQVHGAELSLVIVGHSFGGYSALRLGRKLEARAIPIAAMLTVDARTTPLNYRFFSKPGNVREHANYFQKSPWMPGYAIDGARNQRLQVMHGGIPAAPEVVATYRRMVR